MRTQAEILERIEAVKNDDFFGFQRSDLIDYLDFEHAKPYLKDGVSEAQWAEREILEPEQAILDYLPFAWEKANDERGLSANRSMEHMKAWLWLAGDDDVSWIDERYEFYGKPHLERISERFGFDWKAHDNGRRVN